SSCGNRPPPGRGVGAATEVKAQSHGQAECSALHPARDARRRSSEEQVERVDAEQLDAAANEHAAQHCSDDLPGCPAAYDEFGGRHPDAYPETSDGGEKCG